MSIVSFLNKLMSVKVFCATQEREVSILPYDPENIICMQSDCQFHDGNPEGMKLDFYTVSNGVRMMACDRSPAVRLSQMMSCGGCKNNTTVDSPHSCKKCGRMLCGKCGEFCKDHRNL